MQQNSRKKRLEHLAWLLDNSIPIPFASRKIGLDSVIGLIPGLGDAVGGLLSTWILLQGVQLQVPKMTLARMVLNIALEVVIGFIPVVGDLFDMAWKANHRNVRLLDDYIDAPQATARGSVIWLVTIFVGLFGIGIATIWFGLRLLMGSIGWILAMFGG